MANDHDDTSSVVLEDSCCRTLHQLTVRAERCAVGNVDAARNMASAEAGDSGVKVHSFEQVRQVPGAMAKEGGKPGFLFFSPCSCTLNFMGTTVSLDSMDTIDNSKKISRQFNDTLIRALVILLISPTSNTKSM